MPSVSEGPDVQFQALVQLKDEDEQWNKLRARVIQLTHSMLDLSELGCYQDSAVDDIFRMISEEFVDIFPDDTDKEKRQHFLRQWILKTHRGRRINQRRRRWRRSSEDPSDIINLAESSEKENIAHKDQGSSKHNEPETGKQSVVDHGPGAYRRHSKRILSRSVRPCALSRKTTPPLHESVSAEGKERSLRTTFANIQPLLNHLNISPVASHSDHSPDTREFRCTTIESFATVQVPPAIPSPVTSPTDNTPESDSCKSVASPRNVSQGDNNPQDQFPSSTLATCAHDKPFASRFYKFKPAVGNSPNGHTYIPGLPVLSPRNNSCIPEAKQPVTEKPHTYVFNFLKACNPPMDHYYDQFVKAGCVGYQYLYAMSTWPQHMRRNFISTLGGGEPSEDGSSSKPTEIDVLVIDRMIEVVFGLEY
ncbi:hypothetical protein CVT24_009068 [Panaeolus cyanescens]|uniref:Uncharacterized protein n=1 Tax=Panaeolus cyanescens TaxID=181874 RepID=A0A409VDG0_9AGAR|nr:hypothetical protein CVT24_009068 [Panaeolus cyanescens]